MNIKNEFDLYCWIKLYFYRDSDFSYKDEPWAKRWGSPLVALQNAKISCSKFAEVLAHELWKKGFRKVEDLEIEDK